MGLKTKSHNKGDEEMEEDKEIPLHAPIKAVKVNCFIGFDEIIYTYL